MSDKLIGVRADVRMKTDDEEKNVFISFEPITSEFVTASGIPDSEVFYYANSKDDFMQLLKLGEHDVDFVVLNVTEWVHYYPEQPDLTEAQSE